MAKRLIAFLLCLCLLAAAGCEPKEEQPEFIITFSATNTVGNTNGNIANMGLGVVQGDTTVYTDLATGRLLLTHDGGEHALPLFEDFNDVFACLNLTGNRIDYVSSLYGDVNAAFLDGFDVQALLPCNSYCILRSDDVLYYVSEEDGYIYRYLDECGDIERVSGRVMYDSSVTDSSVHPSFSLWNGGIYYCAATENNTVYRVDVVSLEETALPITNVKMLIVDNDKVFFTDSSRGDRLYVYADGETKRLADCPVSCFNVDKNAVYYADANEGRFLRTSLISGARESICDADSVMYVNLLNDFALLYSYSNGTMKTQFVRIG